MGKQEYLLSKQEFNLSEGLDFNSKGNIVKRKGYKSLRGLIYMLKLLNRRYGKLGVSIDLKIRLPLKEK